MEFDILRCWSAEDAVQKIKSTLCDVGNCKTEYFYFEIQEFVNQNQVYEKLGASKFSVEKWEKAAGHRKFSRHPLDTNSAKPSSRKFQTRPRNPNFCLVILFIHNNKAGDVITGLTWSIKTELLPLRGLTFVSCSWLRRTEPLREHSDKEMNSIDYACIGGGSMALEHVLGSASIGISAGGVSALGRVLSRFSVPIEERFHPIDRTTGSVRNVPYFRIGISWLYSPGINERNVRMYQ